MEPTLDIRDLSKYYRKPQSRVAALENVSFEVGAGEFAVVKGPSGSGKTTLLLAAGCLLTPDAGQVLLSGLDPYALGPGKRAAIRAAQIGFVFQEFQLVPYLNVTENVLAPSLATHVPDVRKRAGELISRFGLGDRSRHLPAELSTGEKQRAALARALLNRPKLLLADEPTGNLDRENAELVLDCLSGFAQAGGAVLLVTHGEDASHYAHRTLILEHGKLRQDKGHGHEPRQIDGST